MHYKNVLKPDAFTCWPPLLAGVLITFLTAWALNYQNEYQVRNYTNGLADKAETLIEQRFQHFEYGLRGARGAIAAVGVNNINRKQFERYSNSRDVAYEFPGALGFGFIRRVPAEQESSFIADAREDDAPNFSIKSLTPHDKDRFVIQYIYPIDKNRQAIGLDIGSEANRRSAAILAAKNDKPYLTAPITLVQVDKKPRKGALVLFPIYSEDMPLDSPEAREKAVTGWSYAPLVIDDVLADIKDLTDQASVSLTNMTEREPFYHSKDVDASDLLKQQAAKEGVARNIFVLGQHWKMELIPSIQAIDRVRSWPIGWVIIFGLGLTLCSFFIISVLRTHSLGEDQEDDIHQLSLQSIFAFLKTPQFKQPYPFVLLMIFLIFVVSSGFILRGHLQDVSHNLLKTKGSALSILDTESDRYRRDTLFLANTPPIRALEKLYFDDPHLEKNKAQLRQWNERLADILKTYMLSKRDVYQVRFIGAVNDWREVVKVQRFGEVPEVFSDELLQSKENEPYISQTLHVGADNVFESDINLNREFGKIEQPSRPVWRFSTPLFHSDGRPFGIVIVNVSADHLLKAFAKSVAEETQLYITNKEGDFLLHPNASRAFTFEYGNPNRWQDVFTPTTLFYGLSSFKLMSFQGEQGDVFVEQCIFPLSGDIDLNGNTDERFLRIYSTASQFLIIRQIAVEIGGVTVVLLFIALTGFAIQYWVWLREKIRQRNVLNAQIEDQRNKEMGRFKGLLESAPDATFVVNEAGIIQIVNAQAERMFGYDRLELEGVSIHKLLPTHFSNTYEAQILNCIRQPGATSTASNKELIALRADGCEFPIEISLSAINLDETILVSVSVRDVTERLIIDEKLRTALRDAELATEAKSAFLANTSHEIRTPLNAIIGLGYLLAEEQLTEEQHQLVAKIQISGKSLLGIVNDVLDLSKIEANEMELEMQPVELRELFEEVFSVFSVQAEAKHLEFSFELDPQLPSWVITDSVRLRQILANLLSNALKFTTIGKISFQAKVVPGPEALPEHHINIRLTVVDTGIGISPKAQARLFKPFTQADSSTTRRFGGTGLGLSIVHQLIELMGGSIGVESTEDIGSQFWVDLPFRVQTSDEAAAQDNQNQALFVLIAEDNPADTIQLQKMTRALGWRSEVVSNGDELVKAYMARQDNKLRPPDAMIVDWQMPLMNGLDAINALAHQIGRENLPAVLMVSAHDKDRITAYTPENLVNRFLMKPINASALFNAVNDIVTLNTGNSKRVLQSTRTEAIGAKWLPDMRVLVVDDSPTNLVVVGHILEHNGAVVQTANSGEEALLLLEETSNDYDAVLMDVQMPGIDGLETTRRVRHDLGLTSLPIIALTAGALLEEKNRALEAGMNDFLTKPINPSKLINVLRVLVEAYRGEDISIESLKPHSSEQDAWPVISGLNIEKAKNLLLDDKQLFLNTLNGLLIEHANLIALPEVDIDAPESTALRLQVASQVHKLRSVSGMVGAEEIQQLASEAEKRLRTEHETAKDILTALSLAVQTLQQASSGVLESWKKEKFGASMPKENAPLLQLETVQHILTLLAEQDLGALEEVDKYSASFSDALGDERFQQLQESLARLDYKEAIALLAPLKKTLRTA